MNKPAQLAPAESVRMYEVALSALAEAKGEQISLLDVRKLTDMTDYMLIVTGTSSRHVKALAERVAEKMLESGWKPLGVEGVDSSDWVLVDFVDVVVHIMRESLREHYNLEALWDETLSAVLTPPNNSANLDSQTNDPKASQPATPTAVDR